MGSKIHRALGWGGYHPDDHGLSDRLYEREKQGEVAKLMASAFKEASRDNKFGLIAERDIPSLRGSSSYPGYFRELVTRTGSLEAHGPSLWVLAAPSSCGRWHRRNDDIDYHAKRWQGDSVYLDNEIQWIEEALYPHEAWCWEDPATGIRARNTGHGYTEEGVGPLRLVPPPAIQVLAIEMGFPDWRALKPVLVTWWD